VAAFVVRLRVHKQPFGYSISASFHLHLPRTQPPSTPPRSPTCSTATAMPAWRSSGRPQGKHAATVWKSNRAHLSSPQQFPSAGRRSKYASLRHITTHTATDLRVAKLVKSSSEPTPRHNQRLTSMRTQLSIASPKVSTHSTAKDCDQ
jgi:hypothetical protein